MTLARDSSAVVMAMALVAAASTRTVDADAVIAGDNVLARCQSLVASDSAVTTSSFATLPAAAVPQNITTALAAKSIKWEQLSDPMRVGLLWAYGHVLSSTADNGGPKAYSVYTDCDGVETVTAGVKSEDPVGVPMDAIQISQDAFKETSCAVDECSKATNAQCRASISATIKCAIDSTSVPTASGSFWSFASGNDTAIPKPDLFTQKIPLTPGKNGSGSSSSASDESEVGLDQKAKFVSIVTIEMASADNLVDCSNTADTVIPCLALSEATDRKFCRPKVDQVAVDSFLDTIANKLSSSSGSPEAVNKSNSANESTGLSIGAIIGIVGGALVVLGLVAFYFFRSGRKPVESRRPVPDPTYQPYNPKTPALGEDRHGRHGYNRSKTGVVVMEPESGTGNSVDAIDTSGGNDRSMHAQGGQSSPTSTGRSSELYPSTRDRRVSTTTTANPYGKTTQDYMNESDILREFLSDPRILLRRIPHEDLTTLRILSKGSYGEVYLGQLETRHVAMKRLLPEKKHILRSIEQFTGEIRLMTHLEHRNIVSFIGVSWDHVPNICAVVEYMDNGDLAEVLTKSKGRLSWPKEKISISMDIAEGLVYLHSMRPVIVHRDLKSKNVLLNKRGQAKLSDFGVSRKTSVNETMTSGVGTLLWTAPEIIEGRKYSEKADIFSLGVVLSEIDTGEEPYSSMRSDTNNERLPGMQIVQMVRLGELKVRFRDDCPPKIRELAEQCTSLDPDMRPTSMEVAYTLKSIIAPMLRR